MKAVVGATKKHMWTRGARHKTTDEMNMKHVAMTEKTKTKTKKNVKDKM